MFNLLFHECSFYLCCHPKVFEICCIFKDFLVVFVLWYAPHFNYERWTFALLFSMFTSKPCDKWVPVTMTWYILRLQIQIGRLAANILISCCRQPITCGPSDWRLNLSWWEHSESDSSQIMHDVQSFRGADCHTSHWLQMWGRDCQQVNGCTDSWYGEIHSQKAKLGGNKGKVCFKTSNRSLALENLDDSGDINVAWENIRRLKSQLQRAYVSKIRSSMNHGLVKSFQDV